MGDGANQSTSESTYTKVLAKPAFRTLWFGQICSQLAGNSLLFVLALRVYQTTGSNTAVSGLFLAYGIPAVLFGLVAGTAVDRLDKRRVLVLCDMVRSLFGVALLFLSHQVFIVYILTFLNAVITQFYVPAEAPLIPKLVPKPLLVSANSLFSFTYYSSLALGVVLAGPLLRWFGPQGIFVFIAFLFVGASFFSSRIPSQSVGTVGLRHILGYNPWYLAGRIGQHLIEGIRYITGSKEVFEAIMLLTGTQIILAMLATLGPGFADRVLQIDVRDASLLIVGPVVAGIILGALWVGTVGYRYTAAKLIGIGIAAAGWILVAIAVSVRVLRIPQFSFFYRAGAVLPVEMLLFFLLGVANSMLDVPANATLQGNAAGPMRGRVYGMLTAAVGGVGILPVVAGGILADIAGVGKVIFALGVSVVAYSVYRVRYNKR